MTKWQRQKQAIAAGVGLTLAEYEARRQEMYGCRVCGTLTARQCGVCRWPLHQKCEPHHRPYRGPAIVDFSDPEWPRDEYGDAIDVSTHGPSAEGAVEEAYRLAALTLPPLPPPPRRPQ